MAELIAATCGGFAIGWACRREVLKRRLRKPPYSSAAIAWRDAETQRDANDTARAKHAAEFYAKFIDPSLGVPWEEGRTQRGNGSGGATTPKPPIKPQPWSAPPASLRGLGDLVEKVTEKTGIKSLVEKVTGKDCGCGKRRDKLNKLVPFRGEQ